MFLRIIRKIAREFEHAELFWSQEGEDVILRSLFLAEGWEGGFYVDVGAHHPKRFSNTYFFYQRGWRGLNIDANEDAIRLFDKFRPKDVNVCSGVGNVTGTDAMSAVKYYKFQEPAYNTFSQERYEQIKAQVPLRAVVEVPIRPLAELLAKHLPGGQRIHFMNIDVEGMDYEVLLSNDWSVYRPDYVLIEVWNKNKHDVYTGKEFIFLKENGYELAAMANNSFIFRTAK
jgi:FkbM family methyltransferase